MYDRYFSRYQDKPINLLEIGVQKGGSLELWAKYFSNAKNIIGCDINPKWADLTFEDSRIALIIADINTDDAQTTIFQHCDTFDIIVDDGSHTSGDIIQSFTHLFPKLKDGGIYMVEDLHCSYWKDYEGGLSYPLSSIAFFKQLIDVVHREHWQDEESNQDAVKDFFDQYNCFIDEDMLQHVHAVDFLNSICVIHKMPPLSNQLGDRIMGGQHSRKKHRIGSKIKKYASQLFSNQD